MKRYIAHELGEALSVKQAMADDHVLIDSIMAAGERLVRCAADNGLICTCGNGGSACDAMHMAEELVARFRKERAGIRAMHFLDQGTLTAWSNDYSYETAFARQAATFCGPSDVLAAFSTSGKSPNVLAAVEAAKANEAFTIGFTGRTGGRLRDICDITIHIPSDDTARIQEGHQVVYHILCGIIEDAVVA